MAEHLLTAEAALADAAKESARNERGARRQPAKLRRKETFGYWQALASSVLIL